VVGTWQRLERNVAAACVRIVKEHSGRRRWYVSVAIAEVEPKRRNRRPSIGLVSCQGLREPIASSGSHGSQEVWLEHRRGIVGQDGPDLFSGMRSVKEAGYDPDVARPQCFAERMAVIGGIGIGRPGQIADA
jgi:hypothetical protein